MFKLHIFQLTAIVHKFNIIVYKLSKSTEEYILMNIFMNHYYIILLLYYYIIHVPIRILYFVRVYTNQHTILYVSFCYNGLELIALFVLFILCHDH